MLNSFIKIMLITVDITECNGIPYHNPLPFLFCDFSIFLIWIIKIFKKPRPTKQKASSLYWKCTSNFKFPVYCYLFVGESAGANQVIHQIMDVL